nr:retrovirus-related Pol polyprotein from transposon TNT 1-94 [Tanacetum cinerariifolium]
MTTPTVTSSTDSQMHNIIMAVGSRDRPSMLATGRYPQWRSRFLRYIDTRPNVEALRKCILSGPYKPITVLVQKVVVTNDSLAIHEHTTVETPMNMSPANKYHFEAEKEAIHLILTGIGDEIYSTVDACQTAQEIWEAIERLQQGESLNIQDVKTNLFWEFDKFTSHDGETMESYYTRFYKLINEMIINYLTVATMQVNVQFLQQLQPEWSRFVTIVKQQQKLDEVLYHKLFDILKQYQKEFNKLRAERLARNANPLALFATAQANQDPYYQTSKSHKSYAPSSKPSIPTRSHTTTRYKGKEIAKPITPPSETAFEKDSDPEQAQRDKDMQKNLALIAKYFKKIYKPTNNNLRTSSNSRNKNVDTTPRYKNDNQSGQFGNQRTVNVARARENVGSSVVQQFGIQCFNCKEFGLFAKECRKPKRVKDSPYHKEKMLLCKQAEQGVPLQAEQYDWLADTYEEIDEHELEAHYNYMAKIREVPNADSGTDSEPFEQVHNDVGYNVFANDLQHSKQSESISNTCLVETDDSNVIPDSPDINALRESISVRDSCLVALQTKQIESEKYKAFNDRTIDYDKLERVNHKPNVSRPQHKSNQLKDKVMPNNSQVKLKKTQVEAHPRVSSIYSKTKLVTSCNDSLNSRTSNVNAVCATCEKCLVDSNHFACVTKMLNDVNARTKKPNVVPISTKKPKGHANKLVATPHKKKVASKSSNQKPQSYFRMLYEKTSTVRFGNGQFAPILGYGDLVQGNITINRVYYVEGLNYNLFSVGQFCDADLEVASRKSTCFVRDLQGNNLLTGNRGSDLYIISLQESTSSTLLCLMAKASPIQAWLWHQRLSHLNFDYINLLSKRDVVIGLPKLKYVKDQLCSSCKLSKEKKKLIQIKDYSKFERKAKSASYGLMWSNTSC